MKKVLAILVVVSVSTLSLAQTNGQLESKFDAPIMERRNLNLPLTNRNHRPKHTLQRALKLAETYAAKEKVDLSRYFLYEAKYILYGGGGRQEPCWHFWWVHEDGASGHYVEMIVSIDSGKVRRLPSM